MNDLALVKVGEMRGRRRGGKPGRRSMGRSPGSYWGERVRVGWDLYHGARCTHFISLHHDKTKSNHLDHKGSLRKHVLQLILISGTLSALVELEPVSFPSMPLDLACFRASVVTIKR